MSERSVICTIEGRRLDVRAKHLNGIDFLDVADDYVSLCVHFIGPIPDDLDEGGRNFVIEGGQRVTDIKVDHVEMDGGDEFDGDECVRVVVDRPGDGSIYRLCIVAIDDRGRPAGLYPNFDPRYSCIEFSFAAACPSDFDCAPEPVCPPDTRPEPSISYLAKDYGSFRTLMLDRLARLVPDWTERRAPDLAMTLVELLAYVGDELSYYQDAVGTEAYLDTARQRISVRRHARLVDYRIQESVVARAWVFVEVPAGDVTLPEGSFFVTTVPNVDDRGAIETSELPRPGEGTYEAFEPLLPPDRPRPVLRQGHNTIHFHTWGNALCCLPKGATSATLRDGPPVSRPPEPTSEPGAAAQSPSPTPDKGGSQVDPDAGRVLHLEPGDLLLFEEVFGPVTANAADADPAHRHVVRLVGVNRGLDELYDQPILEIEWAVEDALSFPLCISSLGPAPTCLVVDDVSVARGNIVLIEHGRRVSETIGPVPEPAVVDECEAPCRTSEAAPPARPFRPAPLQSAPLAFSAPVRWRDDGAFTAAAELTRQDRQASVPVLWLVDDGHHSPPGTPRRWDVRYDLLESGPDDQHFVVEIDDERRAHLRFGDDELGERPRPGTRFTAQYRVGGGRIGNVGAGTITQLVVDHLTDAGGLRPRNPLAAVGGRDPEPLSDVRLLAPYVFRGVIERAITASDYASLAARIGRSSLQGAGAALRWTGSWYRADVALDVRAAVGDTDPLVAVVTNGMARYRRVGHDLAVDLARTVPLIVALDVCVQPHELRAHVKAELLEVLGSRLTTSGRPGFFDPDSLTFGQSIDVSRIVAAVMAVEGVESVTVTRLERVDQGDAGEIEAGTLPIGPLEIARLDNDPSFPERGQLLLNMGGGR